MGRQSVPKHKKGPNRKDSTPEESRDERQRPLRISLHAIIATDDTIGKQLGDLVIAVTQTLENLLVVLAKLRSTLVISREVAHGERHADDFEITTGILLIDGDDGTVIIQIRIVLQLVPAQHRADRNERP